MTQAFFMYSPGSPDNRGDLIGQLKWAGPYCFDCDISLVTGKPGGFNVPDNPSNYLVFRHDACPKCKRQADDLTSMNRLEPTQDELDEQIKHQWPVRFATLFLYRLPPEQVRKFQKDTAVIDTMRQVITMDSFRKNYINPTKFQFYYKPIKK